MRLGPGHVRSKSTIDREDGLLLRDLPGWTSRRGARPQGDRLSSKSLSGAIDSATREHGTPPDNIPELCTLLQILKGLLADKGWKATHFMEGSRRLIQQRKLRTLWADNRFADFDLKTGPTVDFN